MVAVVALVVVLVILGWVGLSVPVALWLGHMIANRDKNWVRYSVRTSVSTRPPHLN